MMLFAFLWLGLPQVTAQSALPKNDEVHIGKLENGLKYYIHPNQRPKEVVELRLVVDAGSILEDDDQQGLAHFVEHMLFNGTESFPKNELVKHLQSLGVAFGADLNAYTSFDETVYMLPIPTTNPTNLDTGFKILQEWASKASFENDDIDEERGIVLEEERRGRGAMDRMMKEFLPYMLNHSRYSERLPIGKTDIIKNAPYEAFKRFYKDWYRPNLMTVIVSGDVTVEQAEKMIKKYFVNLQNPKNEKTREYYKVAPYSGQQVMVVTDKEAPSYSVGLMFTGREKTKIETKEQFRENLVESLVFNMLNRRYSEAVDGGTADYAGAGAYFGGYGRLNENFSLNISLIESVDKAINGAVAELLRVDKFGFKQAELDRAKVRFMNAAEQRAENKNDRRSSSLVSSYVQHTLNGGALLNPDNNLALYKEILPSITIDEINKVAKEIIESNEDYFALLMGNGVDIKVPTNEEFKNLVNQAFKQEVEDIEEVETKEALITTPLKGGQIVKEYYNKTLDYTTYVLDNGLKIHLKPTDFRDNEIIMRGVKRGGTSKYGVEDKYNIGLGFPSMLGIDMEAGGFGEMTPNDLKNYLTGKNVNLRTNLGGKDATVGGMSNVKDFETLLELAYIKMTAPRMDKDLFDTNIKTTKAQLSFMSGMPQLAFADALADYIMQGDERAPIAIPKPEDFDKIDLERIFEIHHNEFAYADGFEFVFTGNIDKETMLPLITKYLGSLPSNNKKSEVRDNGLRMRPGDNTFKFHKGSEPQSLIMIQAQKRMKYNSDKALLLSMAGDIITNKIIEEIREEHALIYGGSMSGYAEEVPYGSYNLITQMPCGPENVDQILEIFHTEMDNLIKNGPTKADLEKVQKARLESFRKGLEENSRWLAYIVNENVWGSNAKNMMNLEKRINKVKAKQIQKILKEVWVDADKITAILLPEE